MTFSGPRILEAPITRRELATLAADQFGDMIKAAVDIGRDVVAVGGELHSDEESMLLEDGSAQSDVWGVNLYPAVMAEDWVEFDSMINVRPRQGNRSRSVDDESLRARIRVVLARWITE